MKHPKLFLNWLLFTLSAVPLGIPAQTNQPPQEFVGWTTNGDSILQLYRTTTWQTNLLARRHPTFVATNPAFGQWQTRSYSYTNAVFIGFRADSLSQLIWTNYLALTNGRDMRIWSERAHPVGWPTNLPVATWNTNSVIWGMKGVTALSPCWEGEGAPGQVPFTLLTRRHAYTRGHHMGDDGFANNRTGLKVWFFTKDNARVEAVIKQNVVRAGPGPNKIHRDYTIVLFDRDLPETIETMAVAHPEDVQKYYAAPTQGSAPRPFFLTEQTGMVSTGVAPLTVNIWKGGDSGSPNLIPLPGQLVFVGGRSTSGPSREMQEDMDELCRREKLNPAKYPLQWVDLGRLPAK